MSKNYLFLTIAQTKNNFEPVKQSIMLYHANDLFHF